MIIFESDRARSAGELYYSEYRTDLSSRLHLHDSLELVLVKAGSLCLITEGERHILTKGQGALLLPNCIHGYETSHHSDAYVCIFSKDLVGEFAKKTQKLHPVSPIFELSDEDTAARIHAARGSRYLLKSELYRLLDHFDRQTTYAPKATKRTELLGQILTAVAERYAEPLTLRALADELGYDHHYLTNLLQKGLATTFRKLLNEYRVSEAKRLLQSTELTVVQIAGDCGFEALCSFNRNFKEIVGTTPTAWREQHR